MKMWLDIETSALPTDELAKVMPEFAADSRLKDPEKIKASIEEKRADWISKAALRATTGRILAVTTASDDQSPRFHCSPDERTMLDIALHELTQAISLNAPVYTWNGHGFDYPFICQRAAVHGIGAFRQLMTCYRGRWQWHECLVDAMTIFAGPYNRSDGCSLKAVAAALGVGEKSGSGAEFVELLKSDPVKAKEYAMMDVELLRKIVLRMGL